MARTLRRARRPSRPSSRPKPRLRRRKRAARSRSRPTPTSSSSPMPSRWRDLAEQLDRVVVHTFDYGKVSFQKMNGSTPVGAPVQLPAEYEANVVTLDVQDGNE